MNKKEWISKFKKANSVNKFEKIVSICEHKTVLDVGCIGQDKSSESEFWLHAKIKKVSTKLIGSDIDKDGIAPLIEKGFEIYTPDNLKESIGNQKFEVIVMGDVIEHVDNPVEFLKFYIQFLSENGIMIICTPNVFGIRYSLQIFFFGQSGTNPEHTFGFEPYTMLELFDRAKIEPVEFLWLKEYSKPANFKQKIIRIKAAFLILLRRYYHANFMFIVKK